MSGGLGQQGLGQALGGIGNAFDGLFDSQARQNDQHHWAQLAQSESQQRFLEAARVKALVSTPDHDEERTFREQLQKETDEWLKPVTL